MRKRTVWIAAGMAAVMSVTPLGGAVALAEESAEAGTESATEETAAAETESTETESSETETETESSETETAETETEDEADFIAVPYQEEGVWSQVAITNSEYVETGVNIRSAADSESEVLGYLYTGTAVWVIERGEAWTEFYSNGITGYVMNDYLLYGDDVAEIAEVYGAEGVRAEWDDVNIYTDADAGTVKATMDTGDVFQVVNDYGHWIEILYDEDTTAYVSSDDVTSVMLFESATPKDGERVQLEKIYDLVYETETAETYDTYEDTSSSETYVEQTEALPAASTTPSSTSTSTSTQTETTAATEAQTTASTEAVSTEAAATEAASTEAASTEAASTEAASTEAASTEAASTEAASTETTTTESTSSSTDDDAYYDADTDTYYDGNGNIVTSSYEVETEAETTASTEAETAATEAAETEAAAAVATVEETEAASTSSGTDDTTLLAALIYCEAGNQSYEGMVAVGAVVMNRVNSSSFPSTISEVIYQSGQFTPASSGSLASAIANGVPSTCYSAASAAISGEDPTGGALYFNTSAGTGIQIGDHWFY
ncbi:MAG: cell wall hydrolase [Lachnospiraceae bacterium]|nr:cell wall hydrolase [Lachnospiraceae bacterium]